MHLLQLQEIELAAIEAALKYFVLGAIASGLLLYGMSMIYGISGSLNIAQISSFASACNAWDLSKH